MNNCQLFRKLSQDTWRILGRAHKNNLTFGEDAITSIILDQIIDNSKKTILISDTRPRESTCGCDFEVWIGGSRGWYRYAIQAKKLDIGSQTFKTLNHTVGASKIPQIKILEKYCKVSRAYPLYCLYNSKLNNLSPNEDLYACSLVTIENIKTALSSRGGRKYTSLKQKMIPWHALVCIGEDIKSKPFINELIEDNFYSELPDSFSNFINLNPSDNNFIIENIINHDLFSLYQDLDIQNDEFIYPKRILIINNDIIE